MARPAPRTGKADLVQQVVGSCALKHGHNGNANPGPSVPGLAVRRAHEEPKPDPQVDQLMDDWNRLFAPDLGAPLPLTPDRRQLLDARLRETGQPVMQSVIRKAHQWFQRHREPNPLEAIKQCEIGRAHV